MEPLSQARFSQERRQALARHVVRDSTSEPSVSKRSIARMTGKAAGSADRVGARVRVEPVRTLECQRGPRETGGSPWLGVGVVEHQQAIAKAVDETRDVTTGETFGCWRLRQRGPAAVCIGRETYVETTRSAARISRRSSLPCAREITCALAERCLSFCMKRDRSQVKSDCHREVCVISDRRSEIYAKPTGRNRPPQCAARGTSVRQIRVPRQEREEPFVWQTATPLSAAGACCPANGVRGSLRGIHA